jgi:3-hydroxyisobutyrate dehydrogenase-like beta-hydroxyacid dehydrogenase
MRIAFIGLGNMGTPMARNLLRAGHDVTVYNRTPSKAEPLAADGAHVAGSPAEAARDAETVHTMLSDDSALRDVVFGQNGIYAAMTRGAVHISHSTISTGLARELGAGAHVFISAPVFGRPEAAEAKKLIVVAAGPAGQIARCRPLFDAVGRQTVIAGDQPWQANALKLCGNFMIASMLEAFGEAYAVLRKAGVDPHIFLEAMNGLFASPVYANYGALVADERFEPAGFALKLGLKDVRLALAAAEECTAPMPLASLIRDHLISALAAGQGDMDWSSLTRVPARAAGL